MQEISLNDLPPKIAGLYRLRQNGIEVPEFAEVLCSVENVRAEIEHLLEGFHITAAGLSVRSASISEDTSHQANAGRYLSFNGLKDKPSILSAASMIVQDHFEKSNERVCYIIVQQTIASVFSGVVFASFETSGIKVVVESFFGSCRTIVDGAAIPYTSQFTNGAWRHEQQVDESISIFTVHPAVFDQTDFDNIETGSLLHTSLQEFPGMTRLFSATSDAEIKVYTHMPQHVPQAYRLQIEMLAGIAAKLRNEYPGGMDMEWGIDTLGKLYIFQVRHLTRRLQYRQAAAQNGPSIENGGKLNGIPASDGSVSGIIVHENSTVAMPPNCKRILMLYEATVDNTDKLDGYDGVVSVLGGMLCHLAIVCREKSIPCIVGINEMIPEGSHVSFDGGSGIITIEQLAQQQSL